MWQFPFGELRAVSNNCIIYRLHICIQCQSEKSGRFVFENAFDFTRTKSTITKPKTRTSLNSQRWHQFSSQTHLHQFFLFSKSIRQELFRLSLGIIRQEFCFHRQYRFPRLIEKYTKKEISEKSMLFTVLFLFLFFSTLVSLL